MEGDTGRGKANKNQNEREKKKILARPVTLCKLFILCFSNVRMMCIYLREQSAFAPLGLL